MEIRRVALIYDDRARPETTGVYCRRALESLVEVVHFRPDELAAIPSQGFNLYLNIDDGLEYHLPAELHPSAWWAIDTHSASHGAGRRPGISTSSSPPSATARPGSRPRGSRRRSGSPWPAIPMSIVGTRSARSMMLSFVGNMFPGPRAELIERLRRRFRSTYAGRAYFEEMARIYSSARLVFNRSIKNDVNMRVFEAVACGSLLLTNDLAENGQTELLRDGVHLATYREPEELLDKAVYYLEHEATRERIADAGMGEAVARHTYRHRMQSILDQVGGAARRGVVRPSQPATIPIPDANGNGELRVSPGGVTLRVPTPPPRGWLPMWVWLGSQPARTASPRSARSPFLAFQQLLSGPGIL